MHGEVEGGEPEEGPAGHGSERELEHPLHGAGLLCGRAETARCLLERTDRVVADDVGQPARDVAHRGAAEGVGEHVGTTDDVVEQVVGGP